MTSVTLFDDQLALVDKTRHAMRFNKSVLIQAATGFGKTRIAAHMIDLARIRGMRTGFMVPRRELLRQTAQTMDKFKIPYGYFASGYSPSPFKKVQLITSGTLARRLDIAPKLNVLFVDETHFGGVELDRIINHYKKAGSWVIGLSATPMKTSGKGMDEWYDDMVCGPCIRWLIDNGRLSDYRLFAPNIPDLSGIKTVAGDYARGQLASYMEHDRVLIGNAARHYKKHALGRLDVVFCTSIKHAELTSAEFNEMGIPSTFVHGKLGGDEIKRRIMAFAKRDVLALCSVDLLTFGFDLSQAAGIDVTVECMSDLRPTKSLTLQMQKIGRVLRMKNFPALIFDHAGNSGIHGLPCDDRKWTLASKDKRKCGSSDPTIPTRQCSSCYYVHRPSPTCPNCGFEYPILSREIEEVDGDLEEVTEVNRMTPKKEIGMIARRDGLAGLIEYGKDKGYKPGWARKQMMVRGLA